MAELVKISILGDIMCELSTLRQLRRATELDFTSYFLPMQRKLMGSDLVVGNLETPLAGAGAGYTKDLYSFNTPDELAVALAASGISLVSTANNHCLDRGLDGLRRTLDVLDACGIPHTGTYRTAEEARRPCVMDVAGTKVAFVAATGSTNFGEGKCELSADELWAIDLLHPQRMRFYPGASPSVSGLKHKLGTLLSAEQKVGLKRLMGKTVNSPRTDSQYDAEAVDEYVGRLATKIAAAREAADAVILLPHLGGQFNDVPGACADYIMGRLLETGPDAIVGSHPHVVQRCEMRGGVPVAYSIGNYSMSPNSVYLLHELKPEYGVMLHLYLAEGRLARVSFSILKIVEEGPLQVIPVEDLAETCSNETERKGLLDDVAFIYRRFLQRDYPFGEVLPEYDVWDGARA